MAHVARGDLVVVIAGKEKGKKGRVLRVLSEKNRVVVERVMMARRHTKPTQNNKFGGIMEKEAAIHISNVALWCEKCEKPRRAVTSILENSKKSLACRRCGSEFQRRQLQAA